MAKKIVPLWASQKDTHTLLLKIANALLESFPEGCLDISQHAATTRIAKKKAKPADELLALYAPWGTAQSKESTCLDTLKQIQTQALRIQNGDLPLSFLSQLATWLKDEFSCGFSLQVLPKTLCKFDVGPGMYTLSHTRLYLTRYDTHPETRQPCNYPIPLPALSQAMAQIKETLITHIHTHKTHAEHLAPLRNALNLRADDMDIPHTLNETPEGREDLAQRLQLQKYVTWKHFEAVPPSEFTDLEDLWKPMPLTSKIQFLYIWTEKRMTVAQFREFSPFLSPLPKETRRQLTFTDLADHLDNLPDGLLELKKHYVAQNTLDSLKEGAEPTQGIQSHLNHPDDVSKILYLALEEPLSDTLPESSVRDLLAQTILKNMEQRQGDLFSLLTRPNIYKILKKDHLKKILVLFNTDPQIAKHLFDWKMVFIAMNRAKVFSSLFPNGDLIPLQSEPPATALKEVYRLFMQGKDHIQYTQMVPDYVGDYSVRILNIPAINGAQENKTIATLCNWLADQPLADFETNLDTLDILTCYPMWIIKKFSTLRQHIATIEAHRKTLWVRFATHVSEKNKPMLLQMCAILDETKPSKDQDRPQRKLTKCKSTCTEKRLLPPKETDAHTFHDLLYKLWETNHRELVDLPHFSNAKQRKGTQALNPIPVLTEYRATQDTLSPLCAEIITYYMCQIWAQHKSETVIQIPFLEAFLTQHPQELAHVVQFLISNPDLLKRFMSNLWEEPDLLRHFTTNAEAQFQPLPEDHPMRVYFFKQQDMNRVA